jgi:5-methylcytosine-specific restriction endonuclease McrA
MVGVISTAEIGRRISFAQSYFRALESFARLDSLSKVLRGSLALDVPQKYALLHPDLYRDLVRLEDVIGPRSFSVSAMGASCMCDQLWGYRCEFADRPMHQDHMFPYALGGSTDSDNLLTLCDIHNLAKGHDIHIYPWPNKAPRWVEEAILRLADRYPR